MKCVASNSGGEKGLLRWSARLCLRIKKFPQPEEIDNVNLLTSKRDQDLISPNKITPESKIKVTIVEELITN